MNNNIKNSLIIITLVFLNYSLPGTAWCSDEKSNHTHVNSDQVDHSSHMAMMEKKLKRTVENYIIPKVNLVNQDGVEQSLEKILNSEKTVVVDFIFTTCTTICPVLSAGLVAFHKGLDDGANNTVLVSISIDPEHDRPEVLKAYGEKFGMKPGHELLTGSRQDIYSVMNAFDAVMPNKMTHYPLTFFRAPGSKEWVRVFGMMSASDLMKEYRNVSKYL